MKRRHFLQSAATTLATLGVSQWDVWQGGDRYARVLAQNTPRKLALLVGINQYPSANGWSALRGCVTDVQLQQELLIHRFGFIPSDILTLTDTQATRQGILTAFEEHLIAQAQPGDVVVFHYSGHGSQVLDPDRDHADGLNSTFVPIDSPVPLDYPFTGGEVNDIMGHTLFLLMSAIKTENLTVVLDSCHSGGGKRGVLSVRSRDGSTALLPSPAELAYQQNWLSRLNLSPAEFIQRRRENVAKGVVIASARRDQYAADVPFDDFHAGAFTYLMTQYLWQQADSGAIAQTVANLSRSTKSMAQQQSNTIQEPEFESNLPPQAASPPIYFSAMKTQTPAEAVVVSTNGEQVKIWMGGVSHQEIGAFNRGSLLSVVDSNGQAQGQVEITARQGLAADGRLVTATRALVQPGLLLQERSRSIPADLTLRVGLDPSLGAELSAIATALGQLPRIEPVSLTDSDQVQYLLVRMTADQRQLIAADRQAGRAESTTVPLPAVGQVGLCSPGLDPLPGSFGPVGETGTAAVTRLRAKLRSLLAARMIKLLLNLNSSRLNITAAIEEVGRSGETVVAEAFTVRGGGTQSTAASPGLISRDGTTQIAIGTQIQFQLTNREAQDLYVGILVINPEGDMFVIFPNNWAAPEEDSRIPAGRTVTIPEIGVDRFSLTISPPVGTAEVLVIASATPLRTALTALQSVATARGVRGGPVDTGSEPTAVIQGLLDDLNTGATTRSIAVSAVPDTPGYRAIDTTQLAALSITFEVV